MSLPYENVTSGDKAMSEVTKVLQRFGCQSFGHMLDFENKKLIVQFKYRDMQIHLEASMAGYAAAWLREHPYSNRMRKTQKEHEGEALEVAGKAVYSILRDWIKGQITAVECGILSFEGAFLGQILLSDGKTIYQKAITQKLISPPQK